MHDLEDRNAFSNSLLLRMYIKILGRVLLHNILDPILNFFTIFLCFIRDKWFMTIYDASMQCAVTLDTILCNEYTLYFIISLRVSPIVTSDYAGRTMRHACNMNVNCERVQITTVDGWTLVKRKWRSDPHAYSTVSQYLRDI